MNPRYRFIAMVGILLDATACISPGLYATPRTLAPKSVAVGGSAEVGGALLIREEGQEAFRAKVYAAPVFVGHMRMGVTKGFEVGASIALPPPYSAALMAKVQLTPPALVDFGIMARLAGSLGFIPLKPEGYCNRNGEKERYCGPLGILQLQTELIPLIGINFLRDMTLVLSPGGRVVLSSETRFGYRLTAGLQWRITDAIALHPEVTYMPRITAEPDAGRGLYGGIALILRGRDGYPKQKDVRSEAQ
jgi:hypothetical protein